MLQRKMTLGHSPDPDDAFMFYGLARQRIPTLGYRFEHILQDIQTLNERATRGELDISAISIHAYACVSDQYALLPSGASMGDGYGPMLVAKQMFTKAEIARKKIAVPGTMTSAFLALQLWLDQTRNTERGTRNSERETPRLNYIVVPFDRIFEAGIRYSLDHRAEAVRHALPFARDMDYELADRFVGMYVNHWTLDYGERGRESIRRFLGRAYERGLIPHRQELQFVV